MKVVFCNRPDWRERSGGDVVQMLQTKAALEAEHGVEAVIANGPGDPAIGGADVVHVFNVQDPELGLPFLEAAKAGGRRIALSTVFWDLTHAGYVSTMARLGQFKPKRAGKANFDRIGKALAASTGKPRYLSREYREKVRRMVELADVLLPNSPEEAEQLTAYVGPLGKPVASVVNAVDLETFSAEPAGPRSGVAMAARIEPTKNQVGLLLAMARQPGTPIALVGSTPDPKYEKEVRRLASLLPNAEVVSAESQPTLGARLRRTAVHVLPSFRESPGLATLEALACGCRAVVASEEYCPVGFYFEELVGTRVFRCDPYDPASISKAIGEALAATDGPDPATWRKRFTWSVAARQTLDAYRLVGA